MGLCTHTPLAQNLEATHTPLVQNLEVGANKGAEFDRDLLARTQIGFVNIDYYCCMIEESDALDDDCGEFMGEVWRLMKYFESK